MRIISLFALALLFAFVVPNSIKTEYTNQENTQSEESLTISSFGEHAILLEWSAASEAGISGYQIERYGQDGTFQNIGYVPAASQGIVSAYRFVDEPELAGSLFYRILCVGLDADKYIYQPYKFSFSPAAPIWNVEVADASRSALEIAFCLAEEGMVQFNLLSEDMSSSAALLNQAFTAGRHLVSIPMNSPEFAFADTGALLEINAGDSKVVRQLR